MALRTIIPDPKDSELLPTKEPQVLIKQRRLLNRWSIFALVFVSAAATVLYVNNVIGVKKLLVESDILQRRIDSMKTVNESLRTESYRLQSSDRITRIAQEKLGLIPPPQAPTILEEKAKP